jgi:hypothetical protein
MTDRGLWIIWYNLPAEGREAHLAWLHGTYIPKILKKPGVLWAAHYKSDKEPPAPRLRHTTDPAVPAGNDYFLLFGGETAHVFSSGAAPYLNRGPGRFDADLTAEDRKMLAMRGGERVCIMTEVARRDGPEANRREGKLTPSPCIQFGTFNCDNTDAENEMMAWYADWRFDALGRLPGCMAIRELVSVSGWAKHGVLYEFVSRQARDANFPNLRKIYPAEGEWSDRAVVKLLHAPESPVVGSRIWPPVK